MENEVLWGLVEGTQDRDQRRFPKKVILKGWTETKRKKACCSRKIEVKQTQDEQDDSDGCIDAWIKLFRMLFRERALREQKQSPNGNKPMAMKRKVKHHNWRDCSKSVEVGKWIRAGKWIQHGTKKNYLRTIWPYEAFRGITRWLSGGTPEAGTECRCEKSSWNRQVIKDVLWNPCARGYSRIL